MVASISVAGNKNYLLKDYYNHDQESSGVWIGFGSKKLGLSGQVDNQEFSNIWQGKTPDGGGALVQNAGAANRKAGWDVSYSAPKSVSILWGLGDDKLKADIEQAQHRAVLDAHQYLEDNAAYTRRGKGGFMHEKTDGLVTATFLHGASREGDMQLHTHSMNFNAAPRRDGTTGSLESQYIYDRKMAAGAVYRARLSHEVEQLGFQIKPTDKGMWEVEGVSDKALEKFSKRSSQIKQNLEENQLEDNALNRERAALATRKAKQRETDIQIRHRWTTEAKEVGITKESIHELQGQARERSEFEQRRNRQVITENTIVKSTQQHSVFKEKDIDLLLANEAAGRGMTYQDIKELKGELMASQELVELEGDKTNRRFTTQRHLDMELELHDRARSLSKDKSHTVESSQIFKAVEKRTLTHEQQRALTHVTAPGGLKMVSGKAGTGKSYFLGAANDAWVGSGYNVQGLALSGKAASGLQEGSGIQSRTIDSFFYSIDKAKEIDSQVNLTNKQSVLVVDEAGMVDTERMARLLREAGNAGSKVVMVGDAGQLQSIQAGGGFDSLSKEHGAVELKKIQRQQAEWARDATRNFAEGRAKQGLHEYNKRGLITVAPTSSQLYSEVIDDWSSAGAIQKPKGHIILGTTNIEVDSLNKLAQQRRLESDQLNKDRHSFLNGQKVYEQDRVLFRENDRGLGVSNGMIGTVREIDNLKGNISVMLDGGETRQFNQSEYDKISLGYALTTHRAQGVTADRAYCVSGGSRLQDQELSYVQASRSRQQTRFYTQAESHKEGVKNLEKAMSKSNRKSLALDHIRQTEHKQRMTLGQIGGREQS